MSDAVLEKLVEEVVALRRRVAHLETLENPALPTSIDADTLDGYHAATAGQSAHVVATDEFGNVTISGGINVGSATNAAPGQVRAVEYCLGSNMIFGGYYSGSVAVQYQNGVYFPVLSSVDVGGSGAFLIVLGEWSSWDEGGDVWWCWVSALCSIRHGTNAGDCISVPCHFAGHAMNGKTVALRTRATWTVAGKLMYLEMCVSESVSLPVTIPWRALRLF